MATREEVTQEVGHRIVPLGCIGRHLQGIRSKIMALKGDFGGIPTEILWFGQAGGS